MQTSVGPVHMFANPAVSGFDGEISFMIFSWEQCRVQWRDWREERENGKLCNVLKREKEHCPVECPLLWICIIALLQLQSFCLEYHKTDAVPFQPTASGGCDTALSKSNLLLVILMFFIRLSIESSNLIELKILFSLFWLIYFKVIVWNYVKVFYHTPVHYSRIISESYLWHLLLLYFPKRLNIAVIHSTHIGCNSTIRYNGSFSYSCLPIITRFIKDHEQLFCFTLHNPSLSLFIVLCSVKH